MVKGIESEIQNILRENNVSETLFPTDCDKVSSFIQEKKNRKLEITKELKQIELKLIEESNNLPNLKACYDFYSWKLEQEQVGQK